jgi:hypothetical protein
MTSAVAPGAVDLYWIPLGAGAHVVRLSGKVYEALRAFIGRRPRRALYHTALEVGVSDGRYVIESAPIRGIEGSERGVVAEGPVGRRWAGRFRLFRYEIRRWREGSIPDAIEAVGVRSASRTTWLAPNAFSIWCHPSQPRCGAETSCTPAICGTPTH